MARGLLNDEGCVETRTWPYLRVTGALCNWILISSILWILEIVFLRNLHFLAFNVRFASFSRVSTLSKCRSYSSVEFSHINISPMQYITLGQSMRIKCIWAWKNSEALGIQNGGQLNRMCQKVFGTWWIFLTSLQEYTGDCWNLKWLLLSCQVVTFELNEWSQVSWILCLDVDLSKIDVRLIILRSGSFSRWISILIS